MLESVRPFPSLTASGQIRRLRALAVGALEHYGLPATETRCAFAAQSFNTIFRIDAPDGRRSALRVGHQQRIHADDTERAEAAWITSLGADGAVAVPDVIAAEDGSVVLSQRHRGIPGQRLCMMFRWIDGPVLGAAMNPRRAHQMGRLAALLHDHAASIALGDPPPVLVANTVLYWQVENRLGELVPAYGSLFAEALERSERAVASLWRNPPHLPHLLHGDLLPANVILSGDEVVPIDFQDLVWGFEIQDLAITLAVRQFADSQELTDCFRAGYQEVRPWPEHEPELVAALLHGRRLHQLNLRLNFGDPGSIDDHALRTARLIAEWMTGSCHVVESLPPDKLQ